MQKRALGLLALVLLLFAAGCQMLTDREYLVISPHIEAQDTGGKEEDGQEILVAADYAQLKEAILSLVTQRSAEGTIRLTTYAGDLNEDLPAACRDIMREDPLGAYAVDYMSHEFSRVVAYYEIKLAITYRRTAQQMDSVVTLDWQGRLDDELLTILKSGQQSLVVRTGYYRESAFDVEAILDGIWYANPELAMPQPEVETMLYPDQGLQRILEINLTYPLSFSDQKLRQQAAAGTAQGIADRVGGDLPAAMRVLQMYDLLAGWTEFDEESAALEFEAEGEQVPFVKNDSFNAYGAFIFGKATPEGYAMAFKWLCNLAELECQVVSGRKDGEPYVWNMVRLGDGLWYHVDVAGDDRDGTLSYGELLQSDEDFAERYRYSTTAYPAATGESFTLEIFAELYPEQFAEYTS